MGIAVSVQEGRTRLPKPPAASIGGFRPRPYSAAVFAPANSAIWSKFM